MILDGRAIAREILQDVRKSLSMHEQAPVLRAVTIAPNEATNSYLRIKERAAETAGITLLVQELAPDTSEEDIIAALVAPGATAVILQLPIPERFDAPRILSHTPVHKDADVLSREARAAGELAQPVAGAVQEILRRANASVSGIKAVVVGEGWLVGAPVAAWLRSAGAEVIVLTEETFTASQSQQALYAADLIVSGAGVPHLIHPGMVKDGVLLIDAGTSVGGGVLKGDIDPACADKASLYTPVPGGVGPITVACLMRNVATLVRKNGFDEAQGAA